MSQQSVLFVSATKNPFRLIVEPWADEFDIPRGQRCRLVAKHPSIVPTFEVEVVRGMLVACVNDSGATCEFWREGSLEADLNIPIPG
jgi:hypothetical protein